MFTTLLRCSTYLVSGTLFSCTMYRILSVWVTEVHERAWILFTIDGDGGTLKSFGRHFESVYDGMHFYHIYVFRASLDRGLYDDFPPKFINIKVTYSCTKTRPDLRSDVIFHVICVLGTFFSSLVPLYMSSFCVPSCTQDRASEAECADDIPRSGWAYEFINRVPS